MVGGEEEEEGVDGESDLGAQASEEEIKITHITPAPLSILYFLKAEIIPIFFSIILPPSIVNRHPIPYYSSIMIFKIIFIITVIIHHSLFPLS